MATRRRYLVEHMNIHNGHKPCENSRASIFAACPPRPSISACTVLPHSLPPATLLRAQRRHKSSARLRAGTNARGRAAAMPPAAAATSRATCARTPTCGLISAHGLVACTLRRRAVRPPPTHIHISCGSGVDARTSSPAKLEGSEELCKETSGSLAAAQMTSCHGTDSYRSQATSRHTCASTLANVRSSALTLAASTAPRAPGILHATRVCTSARPTGATMTARRMRISRSV